MVFARSSASWRDCAGAVGGRYNRLMCGRYVSPGQQDIERLWHVRGTDGLFSARYNVAPTTQVPMVCIDRHEVGRRLALARWGLMPFWAKGPRSPSHTFNARLEEAPAKAMWRKPFREARCIIPALGFMGRSRPESRRSRGAARP